MDLDDRIRVMKREKRVKGESVEGLKISCTQVDLLRMKRMFGFEIGFGGTLMGVKLVKEK